MVYFLLKDEEVVYVGKTTKGIVRPLSHLASGVYGSLNFRCDYFNLDELAYRKDNPPESFD